MHGADCLQEQYGYFDDSHIMGGLLNFGTVLLAGLLNSSGARLGGLGPIGVSFICNKAM